LLKTGQAYLNRDVDPETTAPLALAANRSAGDAFKGRQELAARARGKVLRRPGEIDPYVKRLFQAMGHKVINNRRLEMAQTEAGVTTADEKSMLETANLNLDPTRIEEFAAETDPRKLEQDPRRYALAKEELAVRGLIAQPGHAGGQQDPGNGQPSAVEDDGDSLPRFSGLLEESREQSGAGSDHSQALSEQADADSERSSGGGRILNVGQNVAFDDFMHYMAQSEAVASEQQPGRGAGSEQQQVLEQPVAGQPVIGGRAEEVPEAPVDELAVDGAQQAAVQPEEMQALQPPVVGRVDRNVEDQDDDDEVIRVNDDDDEVVRVDNDDDFEVERLGADDDDDIADDDVSRESIVNHRVGVPNIHRSEDDSDSDSELGSSLHGPQRRWASDDDSDVASEVDPNEMRLMDDDDDVVSVDGHIIKDSRRRQSV
jgi:hypothetical protein